MKTIVKRKEITKAQFLAGVINSIKKSYPTLRQDSKPVTFALQYFGTPGTLVNNSGFGKEEAQDIFTRYHALYKVSAAYAEAKKAGAARNGYADVAFGLSCAESSMEPTQLYTAIVRNSSTTNYKLIVLLPTTNTNFASATTYDITQNKAREFSVFKDINGNFYWQVSEELKANA
jgi:hypothetical protein